MTKMTRAQHFAFDTRQNSAAMGKQVIHGLAAVIAIILSTTHIDAQSQEDVCGPLYTDHFGPFDYRTVSRWDREKVERAHFTSSVEKLERGSSSTIGGDLAYTLKSIPNHPRALAAMAGLARKEKRPTPRGAQYSVECWFERAMRFQPNDHTVRLVYAIELLKDGKTADAIAQLSIAETLAPGDANVQYNLGLAYFNSKDYEKSLAHARQAYGLGFPLPGLRDKLIRAGAWKE